MAKEEEKKVEPEVEVTAATNELEQNAKDIKEAMTPPEGQELKGIRTFCDKHGEITYSAKMLSHDRIVVEDGKQKLIRTNDIVCMACVSDYLKELTKEGKFGNISVAPVFGPIEEKAEEGQDKAEPTEEKASEEKAE